MTQARRSFVIAFTGAVLWVVQAAAQAYPSRPITIMSHPLLEGCRTLLCASSAMKFRAPGDSLW